MEEGTTEHWQAKANEPICSGQCAPAAAAAAAATAVATLKCSSIGDSTIRLHLHASDGRERSTRSLFARAR